MPILLGLVVVRLAVHVPLPDLPSIPWPDLPSIPWPDLPSIPLPDLPDLPDVSVPGWVERALDVAEYAWPVALAYALARAEIRRRRREQERRSGGTDAPTQPSRESGTDEA